MKKNLFALLLLFFVLQTFSQSGKGHTLSKDYYLQKSKKQKTIAWILFGGGTAMVVGGAIAFSHNWDYGSNSATDISGFVMLGGIVADIVSIPFFVRAHKNKERAASVAITNQKILWYQKNSVGFVMQPAVTIRIGL